MRQRVDVRNVRRGACCLQVHVGGILRGHNCSAFQQEWCRAVARMARSGDRRDLAIRQGQRLVRSERVLIQRQRLQLVELALDGQVRPSAAHIRNIGDDILREFPLNSKAPLLRVGPDRFRRNAGDIEGKHRSGRRSWM